MKDPRGLFHCSVGWTPTSAPTIFTGMMAHAILNRGSLLWEVAD
jgi:hypothetical protein